MKKIIFQTILACHAITAFAQQDPLHAQYLANPVVINPALAGMGNNLAINAGYRTQWTTLEGQPKTLNLNGTISLAQNKVGAGIMLSQDKTGTLTNTEVDGLFSYKIKFDNDDVLSFGLQAGVLIFRNNYAQLNTYDVDDPAFTGDAATIALNVGAGVYFKSKKIRIGISAPRMLPSTLNNNLQQFTIYNQHAYAFGSYNIDISPQTTICPSILLRAVENSPLSMDAGVNLNFKRLLTAGVFTRNLNTYGLLLQTLMLNRYKVGYVFEIPANNAVQSGFVTHEVSLSILMHTFRFHDTLMTVF